MAIFAPMAEAQAPLHRDGSWIRDATGGVTLLRGINYSGLEFGNFIGRPNGPEETDFDQMASWGVEVIRLPIAWHYLEPQPGFYDPTHLASQVDPILAWAGARNIAVVLDMHQWLWSPCFGGNGAPRWSCENGGYPPGVQGAFEAQSDFWNGAIGPDGVALTEHLLQAWVMVAARYAGDPRVVALDLFNEPIDIADLQGFETNLLYPFYRQAVSRIRATGNDAMLILEPPVTRNLGIVAQPEPVGDLDILYGPHLYTTTHGFDNLGYTGERAAIVDDYGLAEVEAGVQDAVLWVGEHGGHVDGFPVESEVFLIHALAEQDRRLCGGAVWAYFPSGNGFSLVEADGTEKPGVVDAFARPFPRRTAGTPRYLRYDARTRELWYVFDEDTTRTIPDPTDVFVPASRHYPDGVDVWTLPSDQATLNPSARTLTLTRDPNLPRHFLRVRPANPLSLRPLAPAVGRVGGSYSQAMTASGGTPPYTYQLSAGGLPTGLGLSSAGLLTGTPTVEGLFSASITVTDGSGTARTERLEFQIVDAACPTIRVLAPQLPAASVGRPYRHRIEAQGGQPPYRFGLLAGHLPPGLDLSVDGRVTGTPLIDGSFELAVQVWDAAGCRGVADIQSHVGDRLVVGLGAGPGNPNRVVSLEIDGTTTGVDFVAYGAGSWGTRVGAGDLDHSGHDRILTGPGPGQTLGPQCRGFDRSGAPLGRVNFFAYGTLRWGTHVTSGDLDADDYDEIATAPGPGAVFGPHVRGFDVDGGPVTAMARVSFYAFSTLRFGAEVASADLDVDRQAESIVGAGPGPGFAPHLRAFALGPTGISSVPGVDFWAFAIPTFGVVPAAGSVAFDPSAELLAAPGPGGGSATPDRFVGFRVGANGVSPLSGFDGTFFGGSYGGRPGTAQLDRGDAVELLAASGPDPSQPANLLPVWYDGSGLTAGPHLTPFTNLSYGVDPASGRLTD